MDTDEYIYTPHTPMDAETVTDEFRRLLVAIRAAADVIETAMANGENCLPVIQIGEEGSVPKSATVPFRKN